MKDSYLIRLHIREESELYNPLDPEQLLMSDDVRGYLRAKAAERPRSEMMKVRIESDRPVDRERVKAGFAALIEGERAGLKRERRQNTIKQLWTFLIGIILISVSIVIRKSVPELIATIVSTIGAFAVWEAAGVWILDNPAARQKKIWIDRLAKTEIEVLDGTEDVVSAAEDEEPKTEETAGGEE